MTREELKAHCERQIQQFERVEKIMPVTLNDWKRYEEHKLILELLKQEPKTGHWECNELFYEGESRGAIIRCSKCGNEFKVSPKVFENLYDNEKFCNHCGCRMESEVSE